MGGDLASLRLDPSARGLNLAQAWIKYLQRQQERAADAEESSAASSQEQHASITALPASEAQTEADEGNLLPDPLSMIKQVGNRPISQEQLVAEVKGIYAGLVPVENKCIEICGSVPTSLSNDQYAALLKIFCLLINEHYDFFVASQHAVASPALRNLAKKYNMAGRMWAHGIRAFLELLRMRLPESQECIWSFIHWSYSAMALLDETVPQFRSTWVECKGDIARYGWAMLEEGNARQCWKYVVQEEYTRALNDDPRVGRLYHHLALLVRSQSAPQSERFDATVLALFYFTKSLVVEKPFIAARDSLLTVVIDPIVARTKEEAEKPASVPPNDKDHFLTAVASLILASLEPELLRARGYKTCKEHHLQAVYAALGKIGPARAEQAQTSRIHPSAHLGLLLYQLLLGIPSASGRSSMFAMWAPDLVTSTDRANLPTSMTNARDIHNATIAMVQIMVPYLLQEADTRDLKFWGFIYITLVFMRSLKTRPDLRQWLGGAFHAEMLAPFLNMLLREDETRGGRALESASQSELLKLCSPLNQKEFTATTEEATTSQSANETDQDAQPPDLERTYTLPLPEDELLRGHFFAREADAPYDESSTSSNKDIDKQNEKEAKEARDTEAQRREGLLRDPPLFPAGWFKNSKYDFDERQVRQDYVQDAVTYDNRSRQILCLTAQLIHVFFDFRTDESGSHWISVPGAPAFMPRPDMQMPKIIERDGGAIFVYVHPSFHIAEIEKERIARAQEEKKRQIKEKARASTDVGTAAVEKVDGNAEKQPVAPEEQISESALATVPKLCAIKRWLSDNGDDLDEDESAWIYISDKSREEDAQRTQVTAESDCGDYLLVDMNSLG